MTFEITRENVKLHYVKAEVLDNNIGYITVSSFDEGTADEFKNKLEELQSKNVKSLIIDLRNNGGGIVQEATQIADYLLDKDQKIIITKDKQGKEEITLSKEDKITDLPVVVLVNGYTASSSEILASALKDNNRAKVVGTKTYGKGVIQQLLTLPDGSGLKITSEEYLTPNKTKINGNSKDKSISVLSKYLAVKYSDGIRAVKLSDGQYKELAANETLTLTWDSENDAADGYRWIIYYFVGPNLFSSTNALGNFSTLGYSETYRFIKYIAVNAVIKDFSLFGQLGSMAGRGLDTFRTIGDGYVKASIMSSFSIYQSFPIRYIPSISDGYLKIEDGYSITKDNTTSSSSYYLTNYPTGLDLSGINSGTWDITNFGSRLMSLYVKIPPVDIIIATSSYPTKISKKNWKYIAENAPNVSGKTLTMGTANIATCGGEDSEIITTLKNKGWTIA